MQRFVVQSDEIEGRLDVFYYQPEFIELERKIRKHSSKTLGDFIINISGGATPEKDESEKYYTDSPENGVPFLRVQNVTESGLNLEDCKYINFDTHSGMLKRSQVKEGDLITKITGVGRMAVSSVAPKGFDGNINQHLVAIKTDSHQTSEVLAAFLNSDIGERLAFRRSTGGTRPALDYQALKTIPIVFNSNIVDIMQSAYNQKKQKEAEARRLLDSIDGYVLEELGIKLPEVEEKICFIVNSEEMQNNRFDAYYRQPKFEEVEKAIKRGKFEVKNGEDLFVLIESGKGISPEQFTYKGIGFLEVKNIGFIGISLPEFYVQEDNKLKYVQKGDILTGRVGSIGSFALYDIEDNLAFSDNVLRIKCIASISNLYLTAILNSILVKIQIDRSKKGSLQNVINRLTLNDLKIPLPPLEIQTKIAEEVKRRMSEAERFKLEGARVIEEAKKQVEEMILGDK